MTKKEFCKMILNTVENMNSVAKINDDEKVHAIMALISPLRPKDLKRFAKWGDPDQQTTPDKCW